MAIAQPFTILIDYDCPLCAREGALLSRLDGSRGRLKFVNIASPDFDANTFGTTHDAAMGTIHGVTSDGRLVTGMEVFRRAYGAVGWGWVLAPTGWAMFRPLFDRLYRMFAVARLRWRRCDAGGACHVSAASHPSA